MRQALVVAVVAGLVGVAGTAGDAGAGATVDLLFVGRNGAAIAATDTITVSAGDALTMAVLLSHDKPLTAAIFSLHYDLDSGDELDVVSAFAWRGFGDPVFGPLFQPPPLLPPTDRFIGSFGGATNVLTPPIRPLPLAFGPFAGGYQVGTVVWQVTANVNADGPDTLSGLFNLGVDGFVDLRFNDISDRVIFRSATVQVIPEPGTASLLGLGLVGLLLAHRRRRGPQRR